MSFCCATLAMMPFSSATRVSYPVRWKAGMVLSTGTMFQLRLSSTMRCRLAWYAADDVSITSLVPSMISATDGRLRRYSHHSGDSPARQRMGSAADGLSTENDDQPPLAASEVLVKELPS